jgi:hypothetical protein
VVGSLRLLREAMAKHHGPQDRQRDATGPQSRRGASRRGGERPRGRNETVTDGSVAPKVDREAGREWTRRCWSGSSPGWNGSQPSGCDAGRPGARDGRTVEGRQDQMSRSERGPGGASRRVGAPTDTTGVRVRVDQGHAGRRVLRHERPVGPRREASETTQAHGGERGRPTTRTGRGDGPSQFSD